MRREKVNRINVVSATRNKLAVQREDNTWSSLLSRLSIKKKQSTWAGNRYKLVKTLEGEISH